MRTARGERLAAKSLVIALERKGGGTDAKQQGADEQLDPVAAAEECHRVERCAGQAMASTTMMASA